MNTVVCARCSKVCPAGSGFCRRCGMQLSAYVAAKPTPRSAWARGLIIAVTLASAIMGSLYMLAVIAFRKGASPSPPRAFYTPEPMSSRPIENGPPPLAPLPEWVRRLPDDVSPEPSPGTSVDFRGQYLVQGRFGQKPLSDVVFAGAYLLQADFSRADLDGADFRNADLTQADFGGADLANARFDNAYVSQAHFVFRDTGSVSGKFRLNGGVKEPVPPPEIPAKNMGSASFFMTRISQTSLEGVDLRGAKMEQAEFSAVSLRHADLRGADLRKTRHSYTDFQDAKLDGADLRGADLASAQHLTAEQVASARTDSQTRLPSTR